MVDPTISTCSLGPEAEAATEAHTVVRVKQEANIEIDMAVFYNKKVFLLAGRKKCAPCKTQGSIVVALFQAPTSAVNRWPERS